MGIYTGTSGNDRITPAIVSAGVESDPEGSKPSADDDEINGLGGADVLKGGGGNDTITAAGKGTLMRGGTGNDTITYDTAENDVGVKPTATPATTRSTSTRRTRRAAAPRASSRSSAEAATTRLMPPGVSFPTTAT